MKNNTDKYDLATMKIKIDLYEKFIQDVIDMPKEVSADAIRHMAEYVKETADLYLETK